MTNNTTTVKRPAGLIRERILRYVEDMKVDNERCRRDDGKILNAFENREPTAKEKAAVEYYTDLDLKATQAALKQLGEKALTPEEAREFYRATYESRVLEDDLERDARHYELRQEAIAKHRTPHLYEQAVLEGRVERIIKEHTDPLCYLSFTREDGTRDESHCLPLMQHER